MFQTELCLTLFYIFGRADTESPVSVFAMWAIFLIVHEQELVCIGIVFVPCLHIISIKKQRWHPPNYEWLILHRKSSEELATSPIY